MNLSFPTVLSVALQSQTEYSHFCPQGARGLAQEAGALRPSQQQRRPGTHTQVPRRRGGGRVRGEGVASFLLAVTFGKADVTQTMTCKGQIAPYSFRPQFRWGGN